MIAEPSSSRRTFAADACWPRSGRSAWICGMNDVREPCSASSESAHAMSAARASRRARTSPSASDRGHELRAVDQRQALLRLQPDRLEPGARERLAARQPLAVEPRLALADERQREVRERREVAGRADRAARRDDREHAALEQREQELDGLRRARPSSPSRARSRAGAAPRGRPRRDRGRRRRTRASAAAAVAARPSAPPGSSARRSGRSRC